MPEDKISFKIKTEYNRDAKATYTFDSFEELMFDDNNTLVKLIDNDELLH